ILLSGGTLVFSTDSKNEVIYALVIAKGNDELGGEESNGVEPNDGQQSSGGSSLVDQANWTLGMGALGLQASSSTYRLFSQGYGFSPWVYSKNYPASPHFNRYSLSKVGTGLSRGLAGFGVVVDFVRYRRGEISGGKFGFNAGMAAF